MQSSFNNIKPYMRGWPIVMLAMMLGYAIASKYLNYATPMYESTAKIHLADIHNGVPNSNLYKDLDVFVTAQKINAEIELLKSHALIAKALKKVPFGVQIYRSGSIKSTELYNSSPINIVLIDWYERLNNKLFYIHIDEQNQIRISTDDGYEQKAVLGDTVAFENARIVIQLNKDFVNSKKQVRIADTYFFKAVGLADQIGEVLKGLDVVAVDKDIPVIRISYKSPHPEKSAALPNALAQAYIEDYIENKYSAANITVQFLDERIDEMSRKLANSEHTIRSYREHEGITNISQETETDLRKISQLKIQQTNLKMSLEAVRDLEKYIQSGKENFLDLAPNFEAFTDLLSTEIIKGIKQLQSDKRDLLLKYTERDEKVQVIDAKIKDLTSYLIESITNTKKNLETKYNKLSDDIRVAEQTFVTVPEKERMMTVLNREFEIFQQSYNFLNQKKIEAEIAKAAKIAFHRVITPATAGNKPVSPNRVIIKAVSVALAMMFALILIFIVHTLKARVNNIETIESGSIIPVGLSIPVLKSKLECEKFFMRAVTEWEVKEILKPRFITCITGFSYADGTEFVLQYLPDVFAGLQQHVAIVRIVEHPMSQPQLFQLKEQVQPYITYITINEAYLRLTPVHAWYDQLRAELDQYDQTIIVNTCFDQSFTTAMMVFANLNLICVDTRKTPAKRLIEADLQKEAFGFPNTYWVLNRSGYNPSLIRESIKMLVTLYQRLFIRRS